MTQNSKNQREKNVILVSNSSDRYENDFPSMLSRNSSFGTQFANLTSGFGRQSSIGNLFAGFKRQEKPKEEPIKIQETLTENQRYAQQCLEYQKYLFDDRIKLIIHRMAIRAYMNFKEKNQCVFLSFFIQKLLGIISKKLLLNRFQLLFLEYIFQQTKWKYQVQCIIRHSHQFSTYTHVSESQSHTQLAKNLQIYLLYCSFYSKKSLNQFPGENIFNNYLKTLCHKFKENYQQWTQQSNVSNIKINPKILNTIFKRLTYYSQRDSQQLQNYSLLVEQIIQISPAYNAEKGGSKKKKGAKIKKQDLQNDNSELIDHSNEIKEESSLNNMVGLRQDSQSIPSIPILRNKKQTSYVSNVDGLDPEAYVRGNHHSRMI